jgi:hypothetical protein
MIQVDQGDIERTQRQLDNTIQAVGEADGMKELVTLATLQALRFVQTNIEVAPGSGRTKNSVARKESHALTGILAAHTSYAPFVRDAGHREQFFRYAARVEGPRIMEAFGFEVEARVNRAFQ